MAAALELKLRRKLLLFDLIYAGVLLNVSRKKMRKFISVICLSSQQAKANTSEGCFAALRNLAEAE